MKRSAKPKTAFHDLQEIRKLCGLRMKPYELSSNIEVKYGEHFDQNQTDLYPT